MSTGTQNYTILQRVPTFNYIATLCMVRQTKDYYDCVWKLHVWIAAPAKTYQRETVTVEECAYMESVGFYREPATGKL